ncbi:MAG: hypothetical protein RKP46_12605, partial [Candidatus Accumulibacter sp.]|uniref:hypothetical protein n=1 Tax=Accumulibacter sp. TaxID=2053492 RepID=UPI0028798850
ASRKMSRTIRWHSPGPKKAVSNRPRLGPGAQLEVCGEQLDGRLEVGENFRQTLYFLLLMLDQIDQLGAPADQGGYHVNVCHEKRSCSLNTELFSRSWQPRCGVVAP